MGILGDRIPAKQRVAGVGDQLVIGAVNVLRVPRNDHPGLRHIGHRPSGSAVGVSETELTNTGTGRDGLQRKVWDEPCESFTRK